MIQLCAAVSCLCSCSLSYRTSCAHPLTPMRLTCPSRLLLSYTSSLYVLLAEYFTFCNALPRLEILCFLRSLMLSAQHLLHISPPSSCGSCICLMVVVFLFVPVFIYAGVSSNLKMSSYMPNIIAALGTVLRRCGVSPPYMLTSPSSLITSLKH